MFIIGGFIGFFIASSLHAGCLAPSDRLLISEHRTPVTEYWPQNLDEIRNSWIRNDPKLILASMKFALQASKYWSPYECSDADGEIRRSLYLSYENPTFIMNASYNWEKRMDSGVVWTYRTALFEVQSVVIGTMARHCPEIANQFLAVQSNSSFDNNVNCYNPLTRDIQNLYLLFRNDLISSCFMKISENERIKVKMILDESITDLNENPFVRLSSAPNVYDGRNRKYVL